MQAETRQTRIADAILMEMDQEAETTKRLFNVIPEEKLGWRPHPKARTLGELAMHVAMIAGSVAEIAEMDTKEAGNFPVDPEATSRAQILDAFDESLKKGKAIVSSTDDARAMLEWKLVKDGATLVAMPRAAFWRSIMLNHYYHHRGQLSAYLRELDVELPSIYGPSADTNPFA
ncbi:MAG: damage-inducible protein DinB [Acidobacteria bacterium]|nr:MAG: damage-inducible protein DinB [Acidobacteriota bacterium]